MPNPSEYQHVVIEQVDMENRVVRREERQTNSLDDTLDHIERGYNMARTRVTVDGEIVNRTEFDAVIA